MKRIKKIGCMLVALLMMIQMLPVGRVNAQDDTAPIKIGVLQFVKMKALDDVVVGFQEKLNQSDIADRIEWDVQVGSGDMASMQSFAEKLARDNDILLAVATPAAQALLAVEKEKPIFIAAVADPVGAGIAESLEKSGNNVTGTTNIGPIKEQVELLQKKFPDVKKVGILYNSSEVNAQTQVKIATEAFNDTGIELITKTVTNTNEVGSALDALLNEIELLFMVTDNTIDSSIQLIGGKLRDKKIPTMGSSTSTVEENALMTLSNSYLDYGTQTADMLLRMMSEDLKPSDMPIEKGNNFKVVVNEDFAKAIGVDPANLVAE